MIPEEKKNQNFAALTGIRAIAAYMVFLHHTFISFLYIEGFDVQRELHIGVTIFFVLSGFLISYRYSDDYNLGFSWISEYFVKRIARIFPVYLLIVIPSIILDEQMDTLLSAFLKITLLQGFFSDTFSTPVPQSWSLTVEECFYISAPFIFLLYDRYRSLKPIIFSFTILMAGIIIIGALINTDLLHPISFVLTYTFFGRFFEFMVGFWLAKNLNNEAIFKRFSFQKIKNIYTFLGCAGILACLLMLTQFKIEPYSYGLHHPAGIFTNNIVLPIFILALFYGLIKEKNFISGMLSSKLFGLLGKSSYAFYLIHISFVPFILDLKTIYSQFPVFIILSILIYKYFEEPCNKLIRSAKIKRFIPNIIK